MLSSKLVTNMVKVLLNEKEVTKVSQDSFTISRRNAQRACRNLRGETRNLIRQDSSNYCLFEVTKFHCRRLLETKDNGDKLYCV